MVAAQDLSHAASTGMVRIIGDCKTLGRVTDDGSATARRRLESELGSELAGRLVGALAPGRRARGL